jgi:hypothetical protein
MHGEKNQESSSHTCSGNPTHVPTIPHSTEESIIRLAWAHQEKPREVNSSPYEGSDGLAWSDRRAYGLRLQRRPRLLHHAQEGHLPWSATSSEGSLMCGIVEPKI